MKYYILTSDEKKLLNWFRKEMNQVVLHFDTYSAKGQTEDEA